jgi:hypothetical protein
MINSSTYNDSRNDLSPRLDLVKAETFLASLMESVAPANIEFHGVFSRNYANDIISIEQEKIMDKYQVNIKLSRDSLYHILPEGLFFRENDLRKVAQENNEEKFKALEEKIIREKQKILSFFYPFDKTYLNLRFELEKELNSLAENRTRLLMDVLFDIFPIDTKNNLIRKLIPVLPLASEIRSNKMIWKDLLQNVFYPAKIKVRIVQKSDAEGIKRNMIKTAIHIEKLSNEEFMSIKKDVDVFARFFYEWFLPADMRYEFKVKDVKERFILGGALTLDYNTQMKTSL